MLTILRRSAIALLCAASACAAKSPPPEFAYDHAVSFAGLVSFAWFDDPSWLPPGGNSVVDGPFIDRSVRQAVDEDLSKKGFAKVDADPSFYVSYHEGSGAGLSQDKWEPPTERVRLDGSGLYIGDGAAPYTNPAFVSDSGTKYQRRSTLVLDIRDSRKKLIWRGSRTTEMGTNPDELAKHLDRAVASLLARFPPGAGVRTP